MDYTEIKEVQQLINLQKKCRQDNQFDHINLFADAEQFRFQSKSETSASDTEYKLIKVYEEEQSNSNDENSDLQLNPAVREGLQKITNRQVLQNQNQNQNKRHTTKQLNRILQEEQDHQVINEGEEYQSKWQSEVSNQKINRQTSHLNGVNYDTILEKRGGTTTQVDPQNTNQNAMFGNDDLREYKQSEQSQQPKNFQDIWYKQYKISQEIFKKYPEKIKKYNDVLAEIEKNYQKQNVKPFLEDLQLQDQKLANLQLQFQKNKSCEAGKIVKNKLNEGYNSSDELEEFDSSSCTSSDQDSIILGEFRESEHSDQLHKNKNKTHSLNSNSQIVGLKHSGFIKKKFQDSSGQDSSPPVPPPLLPQLQSQQSDNVTQRLFVRQKTITLEKKRKNKKKMTEILQKNGKQLQRRHTVNLEENNSQCNVPGQKRKISNENDLSHSNGQIQVNNNKEVDEFHDNLDQKLEFRPKHEQLYLYEYEKLYLSQKSNIQRVNYVFGNYSIKDTSQLILTRAYYFGTSFYLCFLINKNTYRKIDELVSFLQFIYMQDENSNKDLMRFPADPTFYTIYQGQEEKPSEPDLSLPLVNLQSSIDVLELGEYSFFSTEMIHQDIKLHYTSKVNTVSGSQQNKAPKFALIKPEIYYHYQYEYIFKIESMDPSQELAIGVADQYKLGGPENFILDKQHIKDSGAYLIQANGRVFSSHNEVINNTIQNFYFSTNHVVHIIVDLQQRTITYINKTAKISYLQKISDFQQCHACCVLTSNQDQISFTTPESPAFQQPSLVLNENYSKSKYGVNNNISTGVGNNEYSESSYNNLLGNQGLNEQTINGNFNIEQQKFLFFDDEVEEYLKKGLVALKVIIINLKGQEFYQTLVVEKEKKVEDLYKILSVNAENSEINKKNCFLSLSKVYAEGFKFPINNILPVEMLPQRNIVYCHYRDFQHEQLQDEIQKYQQQQQNNQNQSNSGIENNNKSEENSSYSQNNMYTKYQSDKYSNILNLYSRQRTQLNIHNKASIDGGRNGNNLDSTRLTQNNLYSASQFFSNRYNTASHYLSSNINSNQQLQNDEDITLRMRNSDNNNYEEDEHVAIFMEIWKEIDYDLDKYCRENLENYEEFSFVKVLRKGGKTIQERRIIGIDGEMIYNKLPPAQTGFEKFFEYFRPNLKTKNPQIMFDDIIDIKIKSDRRYIVLYMKQEYGKMKQWNLKAQSAEDGRKFFIKVFLLKMDYFNFQ